MKNKLYIALFLFMTAIAGLTVAGCVQQTPVPQYSEDVTFSVIYTHDDVMNLTSRAVKDDTAVALNSVITDRNLKINAIDFKAIEADLTAIRDSERRIQLLRNYAKGSQIILLNEISTEFYSALSGRYRWNVDVHLSIYDLITRNTLEEKFTIPAVLMYSHENGDDAIESVQSEIQRRTGSLIDAFLKGRVVRNDAAVTETARSESAQKSASQSVAKVIEETAGSSVESAVEAASDAASESSANNTQNGENAPAAE